MSGESTHTRDQTKWSGAFKAVNSAVQYNQRTSPVSSNFDPVIKKPMSPPLLAPTVSAKPFVPSGKTEIAFGDVALSDAAFKALHASTHVPASVPIVEQQQASPVVNQQTSSVSSTSRSDNSNWRAKELKENQAIANQFARFSERQGVPISDEETERPDDEEASAYEGYRELDTHSVTSSQGSYKKGSKKNSYKGKAKNGAAVHPPLGGNERVVLPIYYAPIPESVSAGDNSWVYDYINNYSGYLSAIGVVHDRSTLIPIAVSSVPRGSDVQGETCYKEPIVEEEEEAESSGAQGFLALMGGGRK